MAESFVEILFNTLIVGISGVGMGVLFTWVIVRNIRYRGERNLPQTFTHHGPQTLKRTYAATKVVTIIIFLLLLVEVWVWITRILEEGIFVNIPIASLETLLLVLLIALLVVQLIFSSANRELLCPICEHKIPINTAWKCPQCGEENPQPQGVINHIFIAHNRSELGCVCASCGEEHPGFICTFCKKPFYFTNKKVRQKPEKCARSVREELAGESTPETETARRGDMTAFAEKVIGTMRDEREGRQLIEKHLEEQEATMSPGDYRRYEETLTDIFNIKVKHRRRALHK